MDGRVPRTYFLISRTEHEGGQETRYFFGVHPIH